MAYDAFISYSHGADGRLAPALQSGLRSLARPFWRIRALRVFRDKTSLSASPALWPAIERGLSTSSYFILLASPEAAASKWVEREVVWWLDNRPADRLLIALTKGELAWDAETSSFDPAGTTVLPAPLFARLDKEPLWVDMRWAGGMETLSLRHQQFRGAVLDLAATIHGRPKEDLDGDDVRHYRFTRAVASTLVALILLASGIAEWQRRVANTQRDVAEEQRGIAETERGVAETQRDLATQRQAEAVEARRIAERNEQEANRQRLLAEERFRQSLAARLAIQSQAVRTEYPDQLALSALLGVEAVRNYASADAVQALRDALVLLPRIEWNASLLSQRVAGLRFSPDGRRIVTADGIWDVSNGRLMAALDHEGRSSVFAMSADGSKIARAGRTADASVWNAVTGALLAGPLRNERPITTIALNPSGNLLAVGAEDNVVRVWDITTRTIIQRLELLDRNLSGPVTRVDFSPDGRHLAASRRTAIQLWDVATWRAVNSLQAGSAVTNFAFNPEGTAVLSASASEARLFDLSGKQNKTLAFDASIGPAAATAFSPDGRYAGVAGQRAIVWELSNDRRIATPAAAMTLAFSPDSTRVALGSRNTVSVVDLHTGAEQARMSHDGTVGMVSFSPDATSIATAAADGRLRLWKAGAAVHVAQIEGAFVRFDAGRLLAEDEDKRVSVWDVRSQPSCGQ